MNSEKILKSTSEIQIQQIRNATVKVSYNGKIFLIDPWLAPKEAMGSFNSLNAGFAPVNSEKADVFMPMCELPFSVDEILKDERLDMESFYQKVKEIIDEKREN